MIRRKIKQEAEYRRNTMTRDISRSVRAGLAAVAVFCALPAGIGPSQAQSKYPERPVRIIVPYGAGGVADVTTRLVAQKVSEAMGQTFVIENRPGAGGIVGAKALLASQPDGYTLFLAGNGSAISESLFKSLPFNVVRDFTPVSPLAEFEMLLATKADSQLDTVAKIVAYAKANPGKLNFGTIAIGSTQHLSAELFKMATGVQAPIVIYKTTPELVTAILRGDVDVGFDYYAAFGPSIVNKQFKVIATSGEQRAPQLPAVPTVKESGYPDFVVTSWNAFHGPAGLPKDIVTKLNEQVVAAQKTPDIQKRMEDLGIQPMIGSPEFLNERMKSDIAKWAKVIEAAGVEKQ
jgi:tripartite-type tricarboxylate transporter receptor subunit TctC